MLFCVAIVNLSSDGRCLFDFINVLGLRYSLAIALLAGLARFIPYVGPFIVWFVTILVALFQGDNYSVWYPGSTSLVLSLRSSRPDLDNIIVPDCTVRLWGSPCGSPCRGACRSQTDRPVGLVLAAPVLASMVLISRYVTRKMLDLDPWTRDQKNQLNEFPCRTYKRSREWLNKTTRR
jgi:hypothetical protein